MSDFTFTVRKVFRGSEKQVAIGIHATFNMTLDVPDGILASLNDMKLCKSKAGKWYVQSPYRTYKTRDKETNEEVDRKVQFIKLWPEEKNWPKQESLVEAVKRELDKVPERGVQPQPQKETAAAADTTTSASSDDAW